MTGYIVKLSDSEEQALRQLSDVELQALAKLLQGESLAAQSSAMECSGTSEARLLALTDAQATARIASRLTRKLFSYREALIPQAESDDDPMELNIFERKENAQRYSA